MKYLLIFHLFFLAASLAWSNEERLVAAVFYVEPFGFKNQKGEISGATSDIIKAIENKSGIRVVQVLLPYKRMIESLKTGSIDFAIFFRSKLGDTFTKRIIPLYDLKTIVVGRKGTNITGYDDLYGIKLATTLGVQYNPQFDDDKQLQITYARDYDGAILKLLHKNVDAIISPEKILYYQLKKLGLKKDILGMYYVLHTNTAWLQFSKLSKNKQYINALKSSIQSLKEEDKINQILNSYFY